MTIEELRSRMRELERKKRDIIKDMVSLHKEFEEGFYLKKGDMCIDSEGKKCWFSRLYWNSEDDIWPLTMVNFENKDGSQSKIERLHYYELKKVLRNEEN